mmetsp:Transcript_43158/g.125710  ORF Transcript_43158/g.125710 Transcript_43158/m.125710 type:complete len:266 (-) Transcript_43158:879-1676(-)
MQVHAVEGVAIAHGQVAVVEGPHLCGGQQALELVVRPAERILGCARPLAVEEDERVVLHWPWRDVEPHVRGGSRLPRDVLGDAQLLQLLPPRVQLLDQIPQVVRIDMRKPHALAEARRGPVHRAVADRLGGGVAAVASPGHGGGHGKERDEARSQLRALPSQARVHRRRPHSAIPAHYGFREQDLEGVVDGQWRRGHRELQEHFVAGRDLPDSNFVHASEDDRPLHVARIAPVVEHGADALAENVDGLRRRHGLALLEYPESGIV